MRRTLLALLLASLPVTALAQEAPAPVEAAAAAAAPAAPAARQARLVGVILSSAQALLWDDERGEYVLHRVGDDAFGGRLVELDADHVVIERGEAREVMELTAPPQMRVAGKRAPKRMPAMVISAVPEHDAVAAAAPIAAPAPAAAPVAAPPVAASATVAAPAPAFVAPARSAELAMSAPAPVAVAPAPPALPPAPVVAPPLPPPAAAPSPAATAPVATPVTPSAPATAPVASAVTPDRRSGPAMMIPRADLDRALGDFAALSQDVQVTQQPEGGFRLAAVRPGSFFERIGLRPNDVVLRVDGRPLNGIDDASAAYAWLRVTDRFTVDLVRDGRPLTLRYVIAQPMTAAR